MNYRQNERLGLILLIVGILFMSIRTFQRVQATYEYETKIGSYWDLSERAATITQKSEYMDKFVKALEESKLEGRYNALFYENNENSFDQNMKSLKSLQKRLKDISTMDENSFAYQTAMQQITAQEQGEAGELLSNLKECWYQKYHYTLWNTIIFWSFLLIQILLIIFGVAMKFDLE